MKPFLPLLHTGLPPPLWCSCYPPSWLYSGRPTCLPKPSCLSASRTVLHWKVPQSSRPPDESPGGATFTTNQLHRSLSQTHTHTPCLQHSSQTWAAYSSTVVKLRCFLYHVCQWAISLCLFFFFDYDEMSVCQPCLGLKPRATQTTFTHTDSGLIINLKMFHLLWLLQSRLWHTCCLQSTIFTHACLVVRVRHVDTYVINLSGFSSETKVFHSNYTGISYSPVWTGQSGGWLAADSNQLQNESLFSTFQCINI